MSHRTRLTFACVSALALISLTHGAFAQCLDWESGAPSPGVNGRVYALATHDDGSGPALYAGGEFSSIGGASISRLARWDGSSWSAVGSPPPSDVYSMAVFDDGSGGGPELYVGGLGDSTFGPAAVRKWDGATWSDVGSLSYSGLFAIVYALAVYDDGTGPALYAGGRIHFGDGSPTPHIAKWDGAHWTTLQAGLNSEVRALAVYDDGSGGGPALYAGGQFTLANNVVSAKRIAKWSAAGWSAVGTGTNTGIVTALHPFDDGAGRALFVGGRFGTAGGVPALNVARWNGTAWSALGAGISSSASTDSVVYALTSFDDGTSAGSALYASGSFGTAGGNAASQIAKWNGSTWSALGSGLTNPQSNRVIAHALATFDDGTDGGADLWAGGVFAFAGGIASSGIAKWRGCGLVGTPYCFGDGSLATPCPCAPPYTVPSPSGAPDAGCANSFQASGARLQATGTTNPDSVRLRGSSQTPAGYSIFISANGTEAAGVAYHDGVRCFGGSFVRFGAQNASGGTILYPNASLGFTVPLHIVSGVMPGLGQVRHYQALYRDALPGFCSAGTLNLTNAVSIVW